VSRRPVHPGVWTDRPPVSARCRAVRAALGPEVARCGGLPSVGRGGSTCRRGPRAAWSPAGIGPDGKRWYDVGHGWLARESAVAQGCRLAAGRVGEHGESRCPSALQGVLCRWPAWCLTMGPGPGGLTTLSGRWARGGPMSSSSEGPTWFGGEQPAAAARPRQVRSAVRQLLRGPWPGRTVVGATGFEPVTSSVSDPTRPAGHVRRTVRNRKDHWKAAGERSCQRPSPPRIRHASQAAVLIPTAGDCCPSAAPAVGAAATSE